MPDLPVHPDDGTPGGPAAGPAMTGGVSRGRKVLTVAVVVVLVALFVVLHLTGVVGAGGH
jgi:hypothetical protein